MPKTVFLQKAHQDFELGKSKLHSKYPFSFKWFAKIFFAFLLLFVVVSAPNYFLQWRFSLTGATAGAIVRDCEETFLGKAYITTVSFDYTANREIYTATDVLGRNRLCEEYFIGSRHIAYYLRDDPALSNLGEFLHSYDWEWTEGVSAFFSIYLFFSIFWIAAHYEEKYYLKRFRQAELILDAVVLKVKRPILLQGMSFEYEFASPQGNLIQAYVRLRDKSLDINVGDKLRILYLNDKTFYVL